MQFQQVHRRPAARMAVFLAALLPSLAHACTLDSGGGPVNITIDASEDVDAGKLISRWTGSVYAGFLAGCIANRRVPIDVNAAMPGLSFVRNVVIDGNTYPAFQPAGRPQAPLLIFQFLTSNGSAPQTMPLDPRIPLHHTGDGITSGALRWAVTRVAAVSRGGSMEGFAGMSLGRVTYVSPNFPTAVKTDTFTVTANVIPKTCSFVDTVVPLDPVNAADLPAAGRVAGLKNFTLVMTCNGAFAVDMKLVDANDAGNTGSRLRPTSNATADGVRVELLNGGVPVVLGRTWTLPLTQNGAQDVVLAARYYREAGTFRPGSVEGQAVISATYR